MKILFCRKDAHDLTKHLKPLLKDHSLIECAKDEVEDHIDQVDVVIPLSSKIDEKIIKAGNFGFIQQFGVGLEGVEIEAATQKGIWVSRVPSTESGNADSVAELALMLMLLLSRQFSKSQKAFSEGQVATPVGQALLNKKVAIIGLGGVGRALAVRLNNLKMEVIGVHEHPERGKPDGVDTMYGLPDLMKAISDADYVITCLNYTKERYHFIDTQELQAMKAGTYFINVARGGLLNENALLEVLKSGHLAGAGLDVFWEEPVDPDHPLFKQNVIATPHIGGVTEISYKRTAHVIAQNIDRYANGKKPKFTANDLDKMKDKG